MSTTIMPKEALMFKIVRVDKDFNESDVLKADNRTPMRFTEKWKALDIAAQLSSNNGTKYLYKVVHVQSEGEHNVFRYGVPARS